MDWSLFFAAMVSATLLPGGSEALLIYRLQQGGDALALVAAATAGNVLGSLITYGIGRLGNEALHRHLANRWLRISDAQIRRAEQWFGRYGQPALLFAWLPVVGDPLCLAAGLLKSRLAWFVTLVTLGKAGRYGLLAWSMS